MPNKNNEDDVFILWKKFTLLYNIYILIISSLYNIFYIYFPRF